MSNDDRHVDPPPQARATIGAALWKALNSPFVLFVLSSLLVTGVTRLYTDRQAAISAHQENRAGLAKLVLELQYRVSRSYQAARTLETMLGQMSESQQYDDRMFQSWMKAVVTPIVASKDYQPAMPEFARVHAAALLQQIDLRSGDIRSEQYPAKDAAESPLEAAFALGDEQLTTFGNLTDAKRITSRTVGRLELLRRYVSLRKADYLCVRKKGGDECPLLEGS